MVNSQSLNEVESFLLPVFVGLDNCSKYYILDFTALDS